MSYTLVQRNRNSWTQDRSGKVIEYERVADCGHKHRTLLGAVRCERKHEAAYSWLGYHGKVEDNSTGRAVIETQAKALWAARDSLARGRA